MTYKHQIQAETSQLIASHRTEPGTPSAPNPLPACSLQNRFQTGLDIARYTADIMRARHGRL
jgi:hypothetical protein